MYIPYGRQNIAPEDIAAVAAVLNSDFLTQGPAVPAFEQAVASYCGAKHGIAVNSATSALHIACLALGVKPADIVWTSPISFVASSNCALYCGAKVDFVDIDRNTYNMSVAALELKLIAAEKNGTLPKVVIPVHLCGQSCDMKAISHLSKKYGFKIIEDASHAIGGKYHGELIGNCRYSDVVVLSFHPVKIITTGEGGMALTNSVELAKSMARLRSHGITRDPSEMTREPDGSWYYQQIELGFNYRMTDIQAALGLSQLSKLEEFIEARHKIVERYDRLLAKHQLTLPFQNADTLSAFHLYVVRMPSGKTGGRNTVFARMREKGIGVNIHYIPIYHQPYYANNGYDATSFPEAEKYYEEALSLPIFPGLTEEQQDYVVEALVSPPGYQTVF